MPKTLNSRTQTISKRKPDAGPSLGTSGPAPAPHPSFSVAEGAKQCPSPARSPDARAHPGFAGGPRRARAADPAERRPHGPGAPEPCPASSAAAAETERGPRAPRRRPAGSRKRPPRSSLLRGRTAAAALHPPPPPDQPHHPNRPGPQPPHVPDFGREVRAAHRCAGGFAGGSREQGDQRPGTLSTGNSVPAHGGWPKPGSRKLVTHTRPRQADF